MTKWAFFLLCLGALLPVRLEASDKNCGDANNMMEMNACFCAQTGKKDQLLNQIYNNALKKYQEDKTRVNQIKLAQKAWMKFRDAHLESIYPIKTANDTDSWRMCHCMEEEELILQRIKELKFLLNPPEGDICSP